MRTRPRLRRLGLAAAAVGLSLALGGCESFDLTDMFPDGKKKLPGERRPVFPEGVPGVPQGIPSELVKGNQPADDPAAMSAPAPEAQQQAAEEEPKPAPRPRRAAARSKPVPTVAPEVQQQNQNTQTSPWPSSEPAQQSAWPAPPQPGSFSR